jgi:AcrR family transcriptional regulator
MDGERGDRRVRRTRRLLREALLALIVEKGYDHVTVQDVLDRADVGRATFYAHFTDKDDLLVSGLVELRDSLRERLATMVRNEGAPVHAHPDLTQVLFEHAANHRQLYRALVGKRGGGVVLTRAREELAGLLREHFEEAATVRRWEPTVPSEVMVQFLVSALLGLLTWWLDNQMPYTPDEMGASFWELAHAGVEGALGSAAIHGESK